MTSSTASAFDALCGELEVVRQRAGGRRGKTKRHALLELEEVLGHGFARLGAVAMRRLRQVAWDIGVTAMVFDTVADAAEARGSETGWDVTQRLVHIAGTLISGLGRASAYLADRRLGAVLMRLVADCPLPAVATALIHSVSDVLGFGRGRGPVRTHAVRDAASTRAFESLLSRLRHPIPLSAVLRLLRRIVASSPAALRAFVNANGGADSMLLDMLASSHNPSVLMRVLDVITALVMASSDERDFYMRANVSAAAAAVAHKVEGHASLLLDVTTADSPKKRLADLAAAARLVQNAWRSHRAWRAWKLLKSYVVRVQRKLRGRIEASRAAAARGRDSQWTTVATKHKAKARELKRKQEELEFVAQLPADRVSGWKRIRAAILIQQVWRKRLQAIRERKAQASGAARDKPDVGEGDGADAENVVPEADPADVGLPTRKPLTAQRLRAHHDAIRTKLAHYKTVSGPTSAKKLAELRVRVEDATSAAQRRAAILPS
ncbi:uncharacterized protein AMSG_07367 [Thecamonas trahens ATCC 50062]|uniref:Uncharacterized protein n=1 Tax=Thecamonas trahens ATCC 50062 TaxID=461836 RepID=A0A0L0DG89_THETB|nr:hypothetical protein AMSG_07367 [Thecamonas trahens ATCC 50062]KNC51352.1 hypothetical protein AMSG_07367 [Thecamonas trahens ATCC 50062]|eukprot:XP_013756272.1 hypothetical protein AMSG_07367 [Thecamonas trahens ATCC 50062]